MKLHRAKNCAWRGFYLYCGSNNDKQLGRVILVPDYNDPRLCIAFPYRVYKSCASLWYPKLFELRIPMPRLGWKMNMSPIRLRLFKALSWFWHNMDGRYGWGSPYRKEDQDHDDERNP